MLSVEPGKQALSAWVALLRTQRLLLERVEGDLKEHQLPPLAWYDVMLELHRAPGRRLRQFEIARRVLLSKYNLSRLLDRLTARGLIRREVCAHDRRGAYAVLLPPGVSLLKRMWSVYGASIATHFSSRFEPAELRQLEMLLERIASSPE